METFMKWLKVGVFAFLLILYETWVSEFHITRTWILSIPELAGSTLMAYFTLPAIWKDKLVEAWEHFVPALCFGICGTYVFALSRIETGQNTLAVFLIGVLLTGICLTVNYAKK